MKTKQNILVTGGAGYIGSHIALLLSKNNYIPVSFDNLSSGRKNNVRWGPLIKGDILDTRKLVETLQDYNISSIIHLAAKSQVAESRKYPELYYLNNVKGTESLLEAMKKCKVNKLIFSSTAAVYGNINKNKINEKELLKPINNYGLTKLQCENLINKKSKINNFNYISLRYFNAAGADPVNNIGETHKRETHLIPKLSKNILTNKDLEVYGTNYKTKDGTCVRDFIHVKDIAKAHLKALLYIEKYKIKGEYNIGTGKGFSILEVIEEYRNLNIGKISIFYKKSRIGDPPKLIADPKKFQKKFNWTTKHSSISNIIKTDFIWRKSIL